MDVVKCFWTIFIYLRKFPTLHYNILTTNFGNYLCIRCGYQDILDRNSNNVKVEMDVSNGDTRRLRETGKQEVSESIWLNIKTAMIWIVYLKPVGDLFLAFELRFISIYVFVGLRLLWLPSKVPVSRVYCEDCSSSGISLCPYIVFNFCQWYQDMYISFTP